MKRRAKQKRGVSSSIINHPEQPITVLKPVATENQTQLFPLEVIDVTPVSVASSHATHEGRMSYVSPQFSFSDIEDTTAKSHTVCFPQIYDNTLRSGSSGELRSFAQLDDQSSESRDHEEVTNVASNSDHDFLVDDEGAPELAAHGTSVTSASPTHAEPKNFTEKNDTGLPHNQRRINRRELKALLKQTKRNRAVLDDTLIAAIDALASRLQSHCLIGLGSSTLSNSVRVAHPPYVLESSPPTRKAVGGRRCGRRGSKRGRATGRILSRSKINNSPAILASWVPLILPHTTQSPGSELRPKLAFTPWLNELSEYRVQRFTSGMQKLLPMFCSGARDSSNGSHELSKPIVSASSGTSQSLPVSSILATGSQKIEPVDANAYTSKYQVVSAEARLQSSVESNAVNNGLPLSNQIDLCELTKSPLAAPKVDRFSRGRSRRRRPYKSRGPFVCISTRNNSERNSQGITETLAISAASGTSAELIYPPSAVASRPVKPSKPRVSRELRGLVTWDAVIAQQKRQQAQEAPDDPVSVVSKQRWQGDPTLAIAEGLLAQAAMDSGEPLVTRTRRVRHSSEAAVGQLRQSTGESETASVVTTATASESTETLSRSRHGEHSSITMKSAVSTASSSITSDLPATNQLMTYGTVEENATGSAQRHPTETESPDSLHFHKDLKSPHSPSCQILNSSNESHSQYVPKYSPISLDPELESHLSVDEMQQTHHETTLLTEEPALPNKSVALKRKRRGFHRRVHPENQPSSIASDSSVCTSPSRNSTKAATLSLTNTGVPGKRRRSRHYVSTSLRLHDSQVCDASYEPPVEDLGASVPYTAPSESAVNECIGMRQSTDSRSPVLPPRKRYKAGSESHSPPVAELLNNSSQHLDEPPEPVPTSPIATRGVMTPPTHSPPVDSRVMTTAVCDETIPSPSSPQPVQKRSRGRPTRRGLASSFPQPTVPIPETPTGVDSPNNPMDRPKREAAAIGFASLVAANLNNNTQIHGQLTSLDSPNTRGSGSEATASTTESAAGVTTPTVSSPVPRGRGRPPKVKTVAQPPAVPSSTCATDSVSGSALPVRRQLRTSSSPSKSSVQPPCSASTEASSLDGHTPPATVLPVEAPASLATTTSDERVHIEPVSTNQSARKVGRPRLRQTVEKPKEDSTKESIDHLSLCEPVTTAAAFKLLPTHNSLFKGHLLKDPFPPELESRFQLKGPLCDFFNRFLNEPDPNDPASRLVSPILFLPPPERYPDFYRFILSAYSGAFIRTRFTDTFFKRVFNPNDQSHAVANEPIFSVEFPSLCLASIVRSFLLQSDTEKIKNQLSQELMLSDSELALISSNPSDATDSMPLLDAAIEHVLSVWESFAGRRSWLGRRISGIRAFYFTLRTECVRSIADEYGQIVPPLKATAVLNMPTSRSSSTSGKKKADRRALERGAEVIRCLCGFRVEGGHVMVQCDRCASWQHLPCLWWALSQAVKQTDPETETSRLCRAALIAAQLAGSGYSADLAESVICGNSENEELPYFCPICLDLANLTLDYPRSLSAAMAMNDIDAVFSLRETTVENEHEFWSLASVNKRHQIRTDEFCFISRSWFELATKSCSDRIDFKSPEETTSIFHPAPADFHDRIIIRIYRLWKDPSGKSWMEGGLFLRPYDVPDFTGASEAPEEPRLWHLQEVVYDETSRLVLPLSAWIGRCSVSCPSAYRVGRLADLISSKEANQLLLGSDTDAVFNQQHTFKPRVDGNQLFFVCEKLFDRTRNCRLEDISPGYLKVNMRPYCFLRKPDTVSGRTALLRQCTAAQLLEYDRTPFTQSEVPVSSSAVKPKGEKLARVVDWLERKRQLDSKIVDQPVTGPTAIPAAVSPTHRVTASYRGRPRGSRGRARAYKQAPQPVAEKCFEDVPDHVVDKLPASNPVPGVDYPNPSPRQTAPYSLKGREPVIELINLTLSEEPLAEIENNQAIGLALIEDGIVTESSDQVLTGSVKLVQSEIQSSIMGDTGKASHTSSQSTSADDRDPTPSYLFSTEVAGRSASYDSVVAQLPSTHTGVLQHSTMMQASESALAISSDKDLVPAGADVAQSANEAEAEAISAAPTPPITSRILKTGTGHQPRSDRCEADANITPKISPMKPVGRRKRQLRTRNSSTSAVHIADSEKPCFFSDTEVPDEREASRVVTDALLPDAHAQHSPANRSAIPDKCSAPDSAFTNVLQISSSQPISPSGETDVIPASSPLLKPDGLHSPLEAQTISSESLEGLESSQDAVILKATIGSTDTADQLAVAKAEHILVGILHTGSSNVFSVQHAVAGCILKEPKTEAPCLPNFTETNDSIAECHLDPKIPPCYSLDFGKCDPSNLENSSDELPKKVEYLQPESALSDSNATPTLDESSSPNESLLSPSNLPSELIGCLPVCVGSLTHLSPLESGTGHDVRGSNEHALTERKALSSNAHSSHRDRRDSQSPTHSQMRSHHHHSPVEKYDHRHVPPAAHFEEHRDRRHSRYDHHERYWPVEHNPKPSYHHCFDDHRRENHDRWHRNRWEQSPSSSGSSHRHHQRNHHTSPKPSSQLGRRSHDRNPSRFSKPSG
ncbi:unnamed protein product [Dicrocoelium dendriticum]|nr:unnamed protein product [Dicrocoelium dendriticum]